MTRGMFSPIQTSVIFAALCIALSIGVSEAFFIAGGAHPFHILVACLSMLLASIIAMVIMFELGIMTEFNIDELGQVAGFGLALALSWLMYFVFFLCLGLIGSLLAVARHLFENGGLPSARASLVFAREIGAASVICSFIPSLVITAATKLGFEPIDK